MDLLFIFGAKYLFVLSVLLAGGYFLMQSREVQKHLVLLGAVSAVLTALVAFIASKLFTNPRPFVVGHFTPLIAHGADNGFPSDHALFTALIASIVFAYNKKLGLALWLIALLVSISRVYVGVHHVIDIIAGMAIAAGMTFVAFLLLGRAKESDQKKII